MTSVEPALHEGAVRVTFGKGQPQYDPLPASVDANGLVMTEWELSAEELDALCTGGRIRLWIWKGVAFVCSRCDAQEPARLSPVKLEVVSSEHGRPV